MPEPFDESLAVGRRTLFAGRQKILSALFCRNRILHLYLRKQITVMKSSLFVGLSVVALILVSCGKSRSRETSLPDHYLLSSEIVSIEKETTNAGALTILHLTLTEEASSRMNVYLQTGLQSATQREISLIGTGERVQMVMTLPVDSRMYSPYWYVLPDVIFVPTDSLPAVLKVLDRKK